MTYRKERVGLVNDVLALGIAAVVVGVLATILGAVELASKVSMRHGVRNRKRPASPTERRSHDVTGVSP